MAYNIPLSNSTVATSPLPQPDPGSDMLASLNALAIDISTNLGMRIATAAPVGGVSSAATTIAQVLLSQNLPSLQALLSPRTTPSVAFGLTSIVTGSAVAGPQLRIRAGGTYGAATTVKKISIVVGSTSFVIATAAAATTSWYGEMQFRKTGASSQQWNGFGSSSGNTFNSLSFGSASEPENGACTVAIIGTSTNGAAGDINAAFLDIEWLP